MGSAHKLEGGTRQFDGFQWMCWGQMAGSSKGGNWGQIGLNTGLDRWMKTQRCFYTDTGKWSVKPFLSIVTGSLSYAVHKPTKSVCVRKAIDSRRGSLWPWRCLAVLLQRARRGAVKLTKKWKHEQTAVTETHVLCRRVWQAKRKKNGRDHGTVITTLVQRKFRWTKWNMNNMN